MLALVPGVRVVHVVIDKTKLLAGSHMSSNQDNFAAKLLLERVAYAAEGWPGGPRIAQVYFGLVGGVDPGYVARYLNHCACRSEGGVPWGAVKWPLKFEATSKFAGLQAADMYSGMLWAAVKHGDRGWLTCVHHQIYRSAAGKVAGFGIKAFPREAESELAWLCRDR